MLIFGKEVELKSCGCNRSDRAGVPIRPTVNIFVKVTNACNARCPFCSNAGAEPVGEFNLEKLLVIVREFMRCGVDVNRVNISGGEPSLCGESVRKLLHAFEDDDLKRLHLHLNTNGVTRLSKSLMREPRWNSISMSLHHYDANRLAGLYGIDDASEVFDLADIDREKLNVSCNLIRGYVDSADEVRKMLDFTLSLDVHRIGFVALMKVNDYCRQHFIDLEDVHIESIPRVHFTESRNRGADCKCTNYLYSSGDRILEIYMRNYANPRYCESSVVYDGQFLRQGFHTDNVIV